MGRAYVPPIITTSTEIRVGQVAHGGLAFRTAARARNQRSPADNRSPSPRTSAMTYPTSRYRTSTGEYVPCARETPRADAVGLSVEATNGRVVQRLRPASLRDRFP